jgi:hypothetical protein
MDVAKSKILEALRDRGQNVRAEWVDRDLPDRVDTVRHAGLLAILGINPADLADEPSP